MHIKVHEEQFYKLIKDKFQILSAYNCRIIYCTGAFGEHYQTPVLVGCVAVAFFSDETRIILTTKLRHNLTTLINVY